MSTPDADDLAEFLGSRVVRVSALHRCGLPRSTIAHRCRPGGPWRPLLPGIVLLHHHRCAGSSSRGYASRVIALAAPPTSLANGFSISRLDSSR
jgi:hypothetical protein